MRAQPITHTSHVAEARRRATEAAESLGFDATRIGRVALVATELATNVIRHGGGGEMLVHRYHDPSGSGIELIALDKGRGIANLTRCLQDGYSTAGSAGHGLGAIRRQSHTLHIASWPQLGTAVLARIDAHTLEAPVPMAPWGCVCLPLPGEVASGDACDALDSPHGRTLIVADGLGHGPNAATAAVEAIRLFRRHQERSVAELLGFLHSGLRATRGAAVAIARFDRGAQKVSYGGIGNISGVILEGTAVRRMVSLNGTAGHNARRMQVFDYPCRNGLVILTSDGLTSGWSLAPYPGLEHAHPSLIAAVLYRDFARRRDDATVLVARGVEP